VTGTVSPEVVKEVASMTDLIVGQLLKGGCAVNDMGGDAIVGVCIRQGLGALEVLL